MTLATQIQRQLEKIGNLAQYDDDSWTLSVSSDYDSTDSQAALNEARAILGDDYEVDWTGDSNTDADGESTDYISITLTGLRRRAATSGRR